MTPNDVPRHSPRGRKRPTDDGDRSLRRVLDHDAEESIVSDARAEFGCAVCEQRAFSPSLRADVCGFVFTSARGRGGRQIRQLWISDALQMKTAAAQVARRQLKLGCRQPSIKSIGRSRERSNYAAPAGKDTMCCEGLGTFGAVIGGAEFRCQ